MDPRTTTALLYLSGVTVSFDGFRALNNLSFTVDPGEMRAVIGPNGAGKTTMMDVVTGKTRADIGEVYFDGSYDLSRLDETEIERIRLSSVEPMDFSDDLLGLMAESPRIAKHVHAPLQSGSDAILRKMHRKYRPRHYADRVNRARQSMPDAAVGADVMVGFPGETDELFEESRQFISSMPFTVNGYIRPPISSLVMPIDLTCCQVLRGVGLSHADRR